MFCIDLKIPILKLKHTTVEGGRGARINKGKGFASSTAKKTVSFTFMDKIRRLKINLNYILHPFLAIFETPY